MAVLGMRAGCAGQNFIFDSFALRHCLVIIVGRTGGEKIGKLIPGTKMVHVIF